MGERPWNSRQAVLSRPRVSPKSLLFFSGTTMSPALNIMEMSCMKKKDMPVTARSRAPALEIAQAAMPTAPQASRVPSTVQAWVSGPPRSRLMLRIWSDIGCCPAKRQRRWGRRSPARPADRRPRAPAPDPAAYSRARSPPVALTAVSSAALDLAVGLDGDQISVVLADLRLARLGRRLVETAIDVPHPVRPTGPGALGGVPLLGQEPDPQRKCAVVERDLVAQRRGDRGRQGSVLAREVRERQKLLQGPRGRGPRLGQEILEGGDRLGGGDR